MSSYEQERGITISTVGDGDVLTREALDDLHNQLNERRESNEANVILIDGAMSGAGKAALMAKLAKENFDVIVCGDSEQTPPKDVCVIPPQSKKLVQAICGFDGITDEYELTMSESFQATANSHVRYSRGGKGDRVRRRQQFRNGRR